MQNGTKRIGRPPAYDRRRALAAMQDLFWRQGFAATSLDDVVAVTAMNRPSLYAAFGDKRAMYLAAFASFAADVRAGVDAALAEPVLTTALTVFYSNAIAQYVSGVVPRGCMAVCVAIMEAPGDEDVRGELRTLLDDVDVALTSRFAAAREAGDANAAFADVDAAGISAAMLHSLAVRARAGASAASLNALAATVVTLLSGRAR